MLVHHSISGAAGLFTTNVPWAHMKIYLSLESERADLALPKRIFRRCGEITGLRQKSIPSHGLVRVAIPSNSGDSQRGASDSAMNQQTIVQNDAFTMAPLGTPLCFSTFKPVFHWLTYYFERPPRGRVLSVSR